MKINSNKFIRAAKAVEDDINRDYHAIFSCHYLEGNELRFYRELFEIGHEPENGTFNGMHRNLFGSILPDKKLNEIRVMALCLAAAIAEDENNEPPS